ncbi:unnamed protein product [Diplocarpon coronariae]
MSTPTAGSKRQNPVRISDPSHPGRNNDADMKPTVYAKPLPRNTQLRKDPHQCRENPDRPRGLLVERDIDTLSLRPRTGGGWLTRTASALGTVSAGTWPMSRYESFLRGWGSAGSQVMYLLFDTWRPVMVRAPGKMTHPSSYSRASVRDAFSRYRHLPGWGPLSRRSRKAEFTLH